LTMGTLGEVKGVALEVGNLVDTVLWVPYAAHEGSQWALEHGSDALGVSKEHKEMAMKGFHGLTSGYDSGMAAARRHGLVSETGAPAVSGALSATFDQGADYAERTAFAGAAPEQGAVFNSYEQGELEGAIGSQVALGFVGVEEVQVGLKVVGAIGSIKGLVESVIRAGSGWYKNLEVIVSAINVALSIIGLRQAKAARKIINLVTAAGGLINVVPPMAQLVRDWTDEALANEPDQREKRLKADYAAVMKALVAVVTEVVRHATAAKPAAGQGEPTQTPVTGGAKPGAVEPAAPPTAARPTAAPVASTGATIEPPAPKPVSAEVTKAHPVGDVPVGGAANDNARRSPNEHVPAILEKHPQLRGPAANDVTPEPPTPIAAPRPKPANEWRMAAGAESEPVPTVPGTRTMDPGLHVVASGGSVKPPGPGAPLASPPPGSTPSAGLTKAPGASGAASAPEATAAAKSAPPPLAARVHYGDLENGRPTGVIGELHPSDLKTGTPTGRTYPPGFEAGELKQANAARGHLLADVLGGSGSDPRNLAYMHRIVNGSAFKTLFEHPVRRALESGDVVRFGVRPLFREGAAAPHALEVWAEGAQGTIVQARSIVAPGLSDVPSP
jgi:hypothetical protein